MRHPRKLIGFAFVHPARNAGNILGMVARAAAMGFSRHQGAWSDALPTRELCACWDCPRRKKISFSAETSGACCASGDRRAVSAWMSPATAANF
jgi:hypothetical protein